MIILIVTFKLTFNIIISRIQKVMISLEFDSIKDKALKLHILGKVC